MKRLKKGQKFIKKVKHSLASRSPGKHSLASRSPGKHSLASRSPGKGFNWELASDVKVRALKLVTDLSMDTVLFERVFFYRSFGSKSRAYARTWGLPKIWQSALGVGPAYIIEVLSRHFDRLSPFDQDKVLLHELSHIPKNFSGALIPHTRRRKGSFHKKLDELINRYFATTLKG